MPYETPERTECANDLEEFLDKAMEELGAMKMSDFKKRHNYATAAKGSPKIKRKESEVKEKHKEEVGVSELTKIVSCLTE